MSEHADRMSAAPPPGGAAWPSDSRRVAQPSAGPSRPARFTVPVTPRGSSEPVDGVGAGPSAAGAPPSGEPAPGAPGAQREGAAAWAGLAGEGAAGAAAAPPEGPAGTPGSQGDAAPGTAHAGAAGTQTEGPPAEAAEAQRDAPAPRAQASEGDDATARERDQYLALAQRTQADFDNYRKRMARELAAAESRGVRKLAVELLPALDNLGLALAAAEAALPGNGESHGGAATSAAHPARLVEGIRLVHNELLAALRRAGVEAFSPEGERFDPNEHEAMAQHPAGDGVEAGTITQVYQQGYRVAGTLIRPARVIVAG